MNYKATLAAMALLAVSAADGNTDRGYTGPLNRASDEYGQKVAEEQRQIERIMGDIISTFRRDEKARAKGLPETIFWTIPAANGEVDIVYRDKGNNAGGYREVMQTTVKTGKDEIKFVDRGANGPRCCTNPPDDVFIGKKRVGDYRHKLWDYYKGIMEGARQYLKRMADWEYLMLSLEKH